MYNTLSNNNLSGIALRILSIIMGILHTLCQRLEVIKSNATHQKPNLRKDLKNYRPVNRLCIITKYVEKAMLEQLNTCLTMQNTYMTT